MLRWLGYGLFWGASQVPVSAVINEHVEFVPSRPRVVNMYTPPSVATLHDVKARLRRVETRVAPDKYPSRIPFIEEMHRVMASKGVVLRRPADC